MDRITVKTIPVPFLPFPLHPEIYSVQEYTKNRTTYYRINNSGYYPVKEYTLSEAIEAHVEHTKHYDARFINYD